MEETISVYVVKYPDRDNLVMRYRDPFTGRQVQRSTGTVDRDEATKAAGEWQADLRNGRYKAASRFTWEEFREKYESEVLTRLADSTGIKVSGILDSVETIINPERVRDVTSGRLSFYVRKLREKPLAESTVAGHVTHLRAALSYAVEWGMLAKVPELPRQQRAKPSQTMKGRPITDAEFLELLANVETVVGPDAAASWDNLLRGLWLSGLRLGEALVLRWENAKGAIVADLGGRRPMLRIPAAAQKSHRTEVLPMAPEFANFLEATPDVDRHGPVFPLTYRRTGRGNAMGVQWVSAVISKIGKGAGVVVNSDTGKTASAHDLRRAFGQRWAARVMPAILQKLMRHKDISTTLKFYVGAEADTMADVLWAAMEKPAVRRGTKLGTTGQPHGLKVQRIA
ncbi:MAG: site-specific integrase [Pirellulales bacterium]